MATAKEKTQSSAPVSGQGKNGVVKVPVELRKIALEVGMTESSSGLFEKPVLNDKGLQEKTAYWDFRADEAGKPHPEGRVRLYDGVEFNDDIFHLNRNPLTATILRRRGDYLAEIERACKQAVGTPEPQVEEKSEPEKKPIEQVDREAHEQYGKKTAEDYKQADKPVASDVPAGGNVPVAPAPKPVPVVKNFNSVDIVVVNGIVIPNQYLAFYEKRKNGVVVGIEPYILGEGLEFLVGQMGLWQDPRANDPSVPTKDLTSPIETVPLRLPGEEDNAWGAKGDAVFECIVRMANGHVAKNIGTATSKNLNERQKKYPIEMAIRRAKNRAIRTATNCNICSLEEIDLDPKNIVEAEWYPTVDKKLISGGGN